MILKLTSTCNFYQKAKATGSHNKILCRFRPYRHQLFCLPAPAHPIIHDKRSGLLPLLPPPHPLLQLGLGRLVLLTSIKGVNQGCSNNPSPSSALVDNIGLIVFNIKYI